MKRVLFVELEAVAAAETEEVADTVTEWASVLERVVSAPVSVPEAEAEAEAEAVADMSSLVAVEETESVSVAVATAVVSLASSRRGTGRRTPAEATLRHSSRTTRDQIRCVTTMVLILRITLKKK